MSPDTAELAADAELASTVAARLSDMPEQIEALVAYEYGRNDPCPCGSGRTYKRCCGA